MSLCLSVCLFFSPCLSVFLCLSVCLSLCPPSLSLSFLSPPLCLFLSLCLFSLSLSLSLSLSSLSLSLSLFFFLVIQGLFRLGSFLFVDQTLNFQQRRKHATQRNASGTLLQCSANFQHLSSQPCQRIRFLTFYISLMSRWSSCFIFFRTCECFPQFSLIWSLFETLRYDVSALILEPSSAVEHQRKDLNGFCDDVHFLCEALCNDSAIWCSVFLIQIDLEIQISMKAIVVCQPALFTERVAWVVFLRELWRMSSTPRTCFHFRLRKDKTSPFWRQSSVG